MNQEQITEGNKIIAEWMGYKPFKSPFGGEGMCIEEKDMSTWREFKDFKYHTSWDWLMPVVEKIECTEMHDVPAYVEISGPAHCRIRLSGYEKRTYSDTKIQAVWLAVVDFIKWHNKQKA